MSSNYSCFYDTTYYINFAKKKIVLEEKASKRCFICHYYVVAVGSFFLILSCIFPRNKMFLLDSHTLGPNCRCFYLYKVLIYNFWPNLLSDIWSRIAMMYLVIDVVKQPHQFAGGIIKVLG